MMMRNPRDGLKGQPPENAFQMVDERSGMVAGSCVVAEELRPGMFPDRPHLVRMDIEGENECLDRLLGASLARAKALSVASNMPSRIYVNCAPDDSETLELLKQFGFKDNDGVLRMRMRLPTFIDAKAPMGCVLVEDQLDDPQEQGYFLERYNALYGENRDLKWLSGVIGHGNFTRILTVAPTGMAGEILLWVENSVGVIFFFDTSRRWRRMGVAKYMIAQACRYARELGAESICADVRALLVPAMRTVESCGFRQDELLVRQPGIDVDLPKGEQD